MRTTDPLPARARRIVRLLAEAYPDAHCALHHDGPLQLLVATILSAQCTDARVNMVTPALFARYPDVKAMAEAEVADVEQIIQSTGFYHNKAKNLILCARQIVERHGGEVPRTMEQLVELAGVGRKTANVVLGVAFDVPGLPVDTHVARLSQRMGLTENVDAVAIETDLCAMLLPPSWTMFGLRMIYHGRQVCHARKPLCEECTFAGALCPRIGVDRPQKSVG